MMDGKLSHIQLATEWRKDSRQEAWLEEARMMGRRAPQFQFPPSKSSRRAGIRHIVFFKFILDLGQTVGLGKVILHTANTCDTKK
eukprot:scaffold212907_cov40-Tisochrysis_lutea.AAC.1